MSWFRVDDLAAFSGKIVEAGNEAAGAWMRAGAWSSGELTDGFIPRHVALTIAPRRVWDRLRDAKAGHEHGLVEEREGGWQIHNFLRRNPSAASVRTARDKTKKRVENWRSNGVRNGVTEGVVTPPPSHPDQIPPKPPQGGVGVPVEAPPGPSPEAGKPLALESPEPKRRRKAPKAPEVPLPDGWGPKPGHYRTGDERGLDRPAVDREAQRFVAQRGSKGATYVDWDKAFTTWLLSPYQAGGGGGGNANGRPQRPLVVAPEPGGGQRIADTMARLAAAETSQS